jgi:ribonuclease Z
MLSEESAGIALRAGARQLVLTHFSPKITDPGDAERAARRVFAQTKAARDGLVLSLAFPD